MQLSRYFTLEEMTFSQTAARDGIDNTPNRIHVANLRALCVDVLDPLREAVGLPIQVTSGFRAPRLNKAVGGAAGSHHLEGKAADIVCPGYPVKKLFRRVVELGLPFEQLIYEGGRQSVWVHVAYVRGSAKREIMTATFPPEGGVVYTRITKAQALAFLTVFQSPPPLTRTLLLSCIGMFLAEGLLGDLPIACFGLWPLDTTAREPGLPGFMPWQIITYAFLHGSLWHLLFNMFALYMFGSEIERLTGPSRFLNLYLAGVVTAAFAQLCVSWWAGGAPSPTVGASGGVFGMLLAYGMAFPKRIIVLLIPPIPMPAWLFVTLYGVVELYFGVTGTADGIAHFAHLGGMLGAWLMIQHWRGGFPFSRR